MNFASWLQSENHSTIQFVSWADDGTVVARINEKDYVYDIDPRKHHGWKWLAQKYPWRVYHLIQQQIASGLGKQIYPEPTVPPIKPVQKFLF